MNDYHLDPPDYPEPPEWYMLIESILEDHVIPDQVIAGINKVLADWVDEHNRSQDYPEPNFAEPDWENHYHIQTTTCRHGKPPHDCDACDHAGDIAYDAARESRRTR